MFVIHQCYHHRHCMVSWAAWAAVVVCIIMAASFHLQYLLFPPLLTQLLNTAHTSTQLFKSCLRTLGLGFLFGLGQSFVRLESVGCIPQLPPLIYVMECIHSEGTSIFTLLCMFPSPPPFKCFVITRSFEWFSMRAHSFHHFQLQLYGVWM